MTDGSAKGFGTILVQKDENRKDFVIEFASQSIGDTKKNYNVMEVEPIINQKDFEQIIIDINAIINKNNPKRKGTIRMEYPPNELNNRRRQHLNWKEKKRERALKVKALRIGLTKEERIELEDLNFVEVIAKGRSIQ
ncbi:hypothetical protein Glove_463g39 [Diversispora epigaea]|uniref:Reverse transcriptase RNase H-like domain-containing protein n=1 Tax=Diversispora epigaea TaxID=1348612 RepID=A0A397GPM2_9GLOM|nr:hypothetical protein Glove_463g39 [Diversispora epigaea]